MKFIELTDGQIDDAVHELLSQSHQHTIKALTLVKILCDLHGCRFYLTNFAYRKHLIKWWGRKSKTEGTSVREIKGIYMYSCPDIYTDFYYFQYSGRNRNGLLMRQGVGSPRRNL